jgi:hypothetical protein
MTIATWAGYPRSYTPGRIRPVQYVVVHYTAGSEGPTSAENGAAYDKTRTDGTSTHCFADSNSVVREVRDVDRAHAARYHGNEIGLQLELCGTAQTRAQWLDPVSLATLRMGAKQTAEWCRGHQLPVRRLTVAETRAAYYNTPGGRPKGIVGHVDCTMAYPEDGGDHTDPGREFPWDVFLSMVSEELGGEGDEVINETDFNVAIWRVHAMFNNLPAVVGGPLKGEPNKLHAALAAVATPVTEEQMAVLVATVRDAAAGGLEEAAFRGAQRAEDT